MDFVFKLARLVVGLYVFSRETHRFVKDVASATERVDAERAEELRRTYRRIVRIIVVMIVVGSVVVPCTTPWLGIPYRGIKVDEAASRIPVGIIISILPGFLYMFAGVALGCLLAPPDFLESEAGAKWLELIGTRNMIAARIVCGLVVLAAIALMAGVGTLLATMPPAPPSR